jgi:hypothetical protein
MQHYWAPAVCVFFALILTALRYLCSTPLPSKISGRAIVVATVVLCAVLLPIRAFASRVGIGLTPPVLKTWASPSDQLLTREEFAKDLGRLNGTSLVFVRYGVQHNDMTEWVYNGADIEHEKIIWARDMGPEKNQELIDYFKGRRVWLLEADETPPRLEPYPTQTESKIAAGQPIP